MRFESIAIKNFRGLQEISFKPDRAANIFAGPNAIGKTTILEAIRLLKGILFPRFSQESQLVLVSLSAVSQHFPQDLDFSALAGDSTQPLVISASILLTNDEIAMVNKLKQDLAVDLLRTNLGRAELPNVSLVQLLSSPQGQVEFQGHLRSVDEYLQTLTKTPTISLTLTIEPNGRARGDNRLGQLALAALERRLPPRSCLVSYFPADRAFPAGEVGIQFGAQDANAQMQSHLAQAAAKYQRLKQTIINDALLTAMSSGAGGTIKDLFSIIFKELLPGKTFAGIAASQVGLLRVHIRDEETGKVFDIDSMSSGEKGLILTFLLIKYSLSAGGIVLIDEPELHLNPAVCQQIVPFLMSHFINKEDLQVFMCTHSPEIVATAFERDDCNLFHLRSGTDVTPIYRNDFGEMFEALRRLGSSTADVLNSRGSVFVEGDHDVESLQAGFYDTLAGYKLAKVGGRSEVEKEFRTLIKIEKEKKLAKIQCFILDSDNRPVPASMASSGYVRCLQWDRYCVENYLLDSKILFDLISQYAAKKPESRGTFEAALRQAGLAQLTGIVVRDVYQTLEPPNPGLRPADLNSGTFEGTALVLAERLASIGLTLSEFEPKAWQEQFVERCRTKEKELKPQWEKEWIKLCNGKLLLATLYQIHQINLDPLSLKKKIIEAMRVEGREGWIHINTSLSNALKL